MNGITIKSVVVVLILSIALPCAAIDLGVVGKTYSILEQDAAEDLKERVKAVNWDSIVAKSKIKEKARNFKPKNLTLLPRAAKEALRMVDMSYTLEFDIPDEKGNVIYPKGYTFNPLDFMKYTKTIVVFDGSDADQVKWVKSSNYIDKLEVIMMITDGDAYGLSEELKTPVYFVDAKILSRLQVKAVPSVAKQKDRYMEVAEIDITHEKYNIITRN